MPYKVFSDADASRLVADYKKMKAEITEMESKRGNKATIAEMKVVLQSKGRTIEAHLKDEIDGVRAIFNTHAVKIDGLAGQAVQYLKTGVAAYEKFKLTNATADRDMATYALPTIQSVLTVAKEDAADYGAAWKVYRAANFTSAGLDAEYVVYFNTEVGKLVSDQKAVNGKVVKIGTFVDQAEALKKMTLKVANAAMREMEDNRQDAKELAEKMENLLKAAKTADKSGATATTRNFKTISDASKNKALVQKAALKNYEAIYTNALNNIKTWKTQVKSMEAIYTTAKKGFEPDELVDPAIKKSLQEALDTIAEAKKFVKDVGETPLVQATRDMEVMRKRMTK